MIINIIQDLFNIYMVAIFAYCLMSWFPGGLNTKIGVILSILVRPYLDMFEFIPPIFNIDFSPIIAVIVLQFVELGLISLITKMI